MGEMAYTDPGGRPPVLRDSLPASISIPLEVHGVILDELLDEKEFLLQYRLLSKSLLRVATPRAFRRLSVWCTGTAASKRGYFNVANTPRLAVHVKEIIWQETTGEIDDDAMDAFSDSIDNICKFPNVHTLRFWFWRSWSELEDDYTKSDTRRLQIRIFKDLANVYLTPGMSVCPKTTPKTLEIRGLITLPNDGLRSGAFKSFMERIETLILSDFLVTKDSVDVFTHTSDEYSAFLSMDLIGLLNSSRNLSSLTLESHFMMVLDWSKVNTLLRLRHLKLENILFSPQSDLEAFILRHKASMKHLHLVDCSIETDTNLPLYNEECPKQRAWKDIFETFELDMVGLEDVVFKPLPGPIDVKDQDKGVNGYVYYDISQGVYPEEAAYMNIYNDDEIELQIGDGEEDRRVYESWQRSIETRLLAL